MLQDIRFHWEIIAAEANAPQKTTKIEWQKKYKNDENGEISLKRWLLSDTRCKLIWHHSTEWTMW